MDRLELVYDHYKESYALHSKAQNRRNKSFLLLCVLEVISFLMLLKPEKIFMLINGTIEQNWNIPLNVGNTIIQTLLWIMIAYVLIRYVQDVLYIERQYSYLGKIEREITNITKIDVFSREGDSYLDKYPMVLNFIDLFYKMFMPILFSAVNVLKIYNEWMALERVTMALVFDTIMFSAIFVITWFYFFEIHPKITRFCKKYIPFVSKVACKLRKILKEV